MVYPLLNPCPRLSRGKTDLVLVAVQGALYTDLTVSSVILALGRSGPVCEAVKFRPAQRADSTIDIHYT